jgi:adenosine kinase
MKVLVSGLVAFDKVLNFPGVFSDHILPNKVHDLNVSFVTENMSEHFGGTGGNIAYNLATLGLDPVLVASAGSDFQTYQYWLETKGVDLSLVRIIPDKVTAFVTVMTDRKDNQIAAAYYGAADEACAWEDQHIPKVPLAIVSPGNADDMRRFPALFRKRKTPFIFDPGQQIPALSADDLRSGMEGARVLIANDYELSLVMEKTGWTEEEILKHAHMLVTTFGEEGSRVRTADRTLDIPAVRTPDVKDPTGAGDAYRSGLIYGMLKEWPLDIAGRFGSVMAAYAVEGVGPQFHEVSLHAARARYARSFGKELPS